MATFIYRAKTADGKEEKGKAEAKDQYALYHDLKAKGLALIFVEEKKDGAGDTDSGFHIPGLTAGKVKMREKITFAQNISSMLEAGLSLSRIFIVMEQQVKNKYFKKIIGEIANEVSAGKTFSEALSAYPKIFPKLFVSMVRAGEEGGTLSPTLKNLAIQMEKNYLSVKRLRGALIYPSIIFMLMIGLAVVLLTYVVPTLTATFVDMKIELPWTTQLIVSSSHLLLDNKIVGILIFLGVIIAAIILFKSESGKRFLDVFSLKIPIIGLLVKEFNSARTARTLASLLSSGVEFVVAIEITRDVLQNHLYKNVLADVKARVQKGDPISEVFAKNSSIYPTFVGEMISVGEETGQLSHVLEGVAHFYEEEVDQKTKDMSTILEPFLMIFIGAGVGFFAVAMITPTYSLLGKI